MFIAIASLLVSKPWGVDNIISEDLKMFLVSIRVLHEIKNSLDGVEIEFIFLKNGVCLYIKTVNLM